MKKVVDSLAILKQCVVENKWFGNRKRIQTSDDVHAIAQVSSDVNIRKDSGENLKYTK